MEKHIGAIKEHNVLLHFESWIHNLTEDRVLVFTAIALNHCVHDKQLIIKGYFITRNRLYLVVKLSECKLEGMLNELSKKIALLVGAYLNNQQKLETNDIWSMGDQSVMFTRHILQDYNLMKIIKGENIELPYHSPRIVYLKKITHHYKYCSIQDYAGILGPVIVHT